MVSLPKIKKEISSFLLSEDGKISDESLLKLGITATALGTGIAALAKKTDAVDPMTMIGIQLVVTELQSIRSHTNSVDLVASGDGVVGSHSHCFNSLGGG